MATAKRRRLTAADFDVTPHAIRAHAILADIDRDRLVIRRLDDGLTQDAVASELGISQATVHRIAKRRDRINAAEPSPIEVIARCFMGQISRAQMVGDLLARTYTAGYIPEGSYDAYVRGTWDDVEYGHAIGLLADDDFEKLLEKIPQ
jgi:hypothetical protein